MDHQLPTLPFASENPEIRLFLSHWFAARQLNDLPVWSGATDSIASLADGIGVYDVRPGAVILEHAGDAMRRFFGYNLVGHDVLNLTVPQFRSYRLRHFQLIVEQPCGLLFTMPWRGRFTGSEKGEAILLPFLRGNSRQIIIAGYFDFPTAAVARGGGSPIVPRGERQAFIDLGFGIPT